MISSQVIRSSIEELRAISKVDLCVWDLEGKVVASTFDAEEITSALIEGFVQSDRKSTRLNSSH